MVAKNTAGYPTVGSKKAIIIGAGFGGLSLGIRLQSLGFNTTIVEKLDKPGGRAYQKITPEGYVFDMGPTVMTVPHFIEELFALKQDKSYLSEPDFPENVVKQQSYGAESAGINTRKYIKLVPISPFYRIYFSDGTFFDYSGDTESTKKQIKALAPEDLEGYEKFHRDAEAIFKRGFLELGYTHFSSISTMLCVLPDLLRLDAVRTLFSFASKYFKSAKLRQVFSFETLLIGGNPLNVPAIYAMIHFVEKTWGIHYVIGGTGALISALVKKYEELGGRIEYSREVEKIIVTDNQSRAVKLPFGRRIARGIQLKSGEVHSADIVISNADWANTYLKLVPSAARLVNNDLRIKATKQSMSLLVVYFGFRDDGSSLNLKHHNIILSQRYAGLLADIFKNRVISKDFSQYLHIPTLTDPTLAPSGCHAAYTLIPVPNQSSQLNWQLEGPKLAQRVLDFLEKQGFIPNLRARLTYCDFITPEYFEITLNSHLGNAFGPEPTLRQSAYFRPHNKSQDISNLYLVGAGVQPGAGTPSVMMSAKMTARLIAQDFGISS
jgi:phytoene desaturase